MIFTFIVNITGIHKNAHISSLQLDDFLYIWTLMYLLSWLRKRSFSTNQQFPFNQWPLVQFSSVTPSCLTLCDPMNNSMPGLLVQHQLPEFTQTQVHWVCDAIQPSHPLYSPSPPALNLSQHWDLFKWVSTSHQMAKVLVFQLQHQSFQWTPRTYLL